MDMEEVWVVILSVCHCIDAVLKVFFEKRKWRGVDGDIYGGDWDCVFLGRIYG
ncbi:hypothetical protein [Bacillus pumilus]|uniref:hypothetical protein n=1 Tax=Bacillus pumilus TaxID=1408 RepID=UPI001642F3A2|nr:hypothetical protein [Bacillus pumilus]